MTEEQEREYPISMILPNALCEVTTEPPVITFGVKYFINPLTRTNQFFGATFCALKLHKLKTGFNISC